jgi:nucleotide-binding universal stress UspA family protein
MRALVEYRRGSIFDDECDVLVIPSTVDGTVPPEMQQAIVEAGLPLPEAMTLGEVILLPSQNLRYRSVAYIAVAVSGQPSSEADFEGIGAKLGWIVKSQDYRKVSASALEAGFANLPAATVAAALARGFQSTAPESAELWISVQDREMLKAVAARLLGVFPHSSATDSSTLSTSTNRRWVSAILSPNARDHSDHQTSDETIRRHVATNIDDGALSTPDDPHPPRAHRPRRKGVFVSYSHADGEWLRRLQKHLQPLQREGIVVWDDTRLKAGEHWREEIRQALAAAKVAILLISADFLASDFIVTNELPPLLKAAEEEGATILPVIISPCRFTRMESLSRFQAVNNPAKPLVKMRQAGREEVLDQVAQAVEDALKK